VIAKKSNWSHCNARYKFAWQQMNPNILTNKCFVSRDVDNELHFDYNYMMEFVK
jgi:hypothetical protein